MDLLHLARTSKSPRGILLKKSTSPIWKRVMKKARMPECPSDINEIQYVQFLCGRTCDVWASPSLQSLSLTAFFQFCNKRKRLYKFWTHRIKACTDCMADTEYYFLFRESPNVAYEEPRHFVDGTTIPTGYIHMNEKNTFTSKGQSK